MTRLDELLLIIDPIEREAALADFARSLGADPFTARNQAGRYNEERLVLLIYDALKIRRRLRWRNLGFLTAGILLSLIGFYFLLSLPKIFSFLLSRQVAKQIPNSNVMRGYDKQGQPVLDEDGQPALFSPMDGPYTEYDEAGNPTYEYEYQNGRLISRKRFGPRGRVIDVEYY